MDKKTKLEPYDITLINKIKKILISKQQTLAVAESVTSGHLQAGFSLATDAMQFFHGGITTYNLGQKARQFAVDPIHAASCNCVSEKVATDMAKGVSKLFTSDWGIAITGYATPDPEQNIEDLFAFYSFCYKDHVMKTGKVSVEKSQQLTTQLFYANSIYKCFFELLSEN